MSWLDGRGFWVHLIAGAARRHVPGGSFLARRLARSEVERETILAVLCRHVSDRELTMDEAEDVLLWVIGMCE